jgi:hypothetical protein
MNIENLDKLINHMKLIREENFSMMDFMRDFPSRRKPENVLKQMETTGGCGTVACLAGHAVLLKAVEDSERLTPRGNLKGDELSVFNITGDMDVRAQKWLDLDDGQMIDLFHKMDSRITAEDTIPVLEHLRDTGIVDWKLSPHMNRKYDE